MALRAAASQCALSVIPTIIGGRYGAHFGDRAGYQNQDGCENQ